MSHFTETGHRMQPRRVGHRTWLCEVCGDAVSIDEVVEHAVEMVAHLSGDLDLVRRDVERCQDEH
jgi:hypothetical protein